MAEFGGMLAASALRLLAGKLAEAAGNRFMLQCTFGEDMEDMRETLESIQAVLKDAERRSIEDEAVRLWLKRLTKASYRITDIFDEYEVNTTRKSALRKLRVLNPCLTLASEVRMAGKMMLVRKKLDNISKQGDRYTFATSSGSTDQQVINERQTLPEVIQAEILGRDEEKQEIMALLSTSSEFIVLPIYGIGGIGKTTLAQLLFNDTHFNSYEKAWVYVSQTFDLNKIKETVRSQLHLEPGQLANTQERDAGPSSPKSILIVLDDLWEENDSKLDDLKMSLKMIGNGHKAHIIVTTRNADIAKKIQTTEAHKINTLSPDVCWTIIKQKADFENKSDYDKERLEDIGKEIAGKCGGVALAARTLGFMLRFMDVNGWLSVKHNPLWNFCKPGNRRSEYHDVLASLKLSYSTMLPQLRLCFAYCAVLPKGHKMAKDELIYQWAALGFIIPSDRISIQQHGEAYIKQLLDMSFFQKSWLSSSGRKDVTFFTMHDLVHDLARSVMGHELHDASVEFKQYKGNNCRYAFLADCSKSLNSYVTYPGKIRALRFLGSGEIGHCSIEFSTAKYLRVLDLGESSLKKFPSSIGQLKLLRYLNAPGIKDRVIPSCITKLSSLIYLSLCGSDELLALPESFGNMKALMYLDLSKCDKLEKLPESFGKLKSLVHLNLSGSYKLLALPESFGEMEALMYLDLSHCKEIENLPESFGKLKSLVHLDLYFCTELNGVPEALCGLTKLQHLNLSICDKLLTGSKGLHEVIGTLTELRYLNLSWSLRVGTFEEENIGIVGSVLDKISNLSNLEHLNLGGGEFVTLPDSFCSLQKLHTLDLSNCLHLKELPTNMGAMVNLKFLIGFNRQTTGINKKLIPLPKFLVHDVEGEPSSNLIRLKDVNPTDLEISCLENVKSIEEAQRIELRGKQRLEDLILDWTRGTNRHVEDMELLRELMPPNGLKWFQLRGYNNVNFPAWLTDIAIYLPNLVRVQLKGLSQCSSLPSLGELVNLCYLILEDMPNIKKLDRGFYGDRRMKVFPQLVELTISNMENLEEWSTTYSCGENVVVKEFMFPNLKSLNITWCPKLRVKPCPPRVTRTWLIESSDGVLQQWEEGAPHTICSTSSAPLVHALRVQSCMVPMHQWKLLHHLPGLRELRINKCNDLICSQEVTQALTSLTSLSLNYCSGLQELPQWLASLTSITSLSLEHCSGIQELPQWLAGLTSLESLHLSSCSGIQALPEQLGDCVSLKELNIWRCKGITFLPESIRKLTCLEKLTVWFCPELRKWSELEENKTKIDHVKKKDLQDW